MLSAIVVETDAEEKALQLQHTMHLTAKRRVRHESDLWVDAKKIGKHH